MVYVDIGMLIILLTTLLVVAYVLGSVVASSGVGSLVAAFTSWEFKSALSLSLVAASLATLLAAPLAVVVAYLLSRRAGFTPLLVESILSLPFMLTPVATGSIVLLFIVQTSVGRALNGAFNLLFTLNGAVLVQFILAFSTMITPMTDAFKNVSVEYEHVSRTLGHGVFSTFFNVVIPLARRGLVSSILMGFMKAFSDFGATVMVAGMILGKTATLPGAIYVEMSTGNVNVALAMILLSVVVSLTISILARVMRSGG
ncbi:molybdate ABC transporter permease subunit [Thermogladius sp.]|uniref:molybdate ABC transporter permease subunit n=1 Tax=Thermogladius sp. TaxID=2023064 RepID=UPI003D0F535D